MILAAGLLLDAALGEPRWLWDRWPHPAVLTGRAIGWLDRRLNRGAGRRGRGVLAIGLLCAGAALLGLGLAALPGSWAEILALGVLLAQRSLVDHVRAVGRALRLSDRDGRLAVARIVGRDTAGMDRAQVARAAVESAAENLSDGVIAPAFWFALGGLPGLLLYKAVNTADSMIGYRSDPYGEFGWAAARLDDLLNLLPARLTAGMIWLAGGRRGDWAAIGRDARQHRSPNAGWPEAAMARALDIALSGPRSYDGVVRDFPFVHHDGRRDAGPCDIDRAVGLLWQAWRIGLILAVLLALA